MRTSAAHLVEADPNTIVRPDPGRPPRVLPPIRDWTEYERRRLMRVWNRVMAGTGAEGILGARVSREE